MIGFPVSLYRAYESGRLLTKWQKRTDSLLVQKSFKRKSATWGYETVRVILLVYQEFQSSDVSARTPRVKMGEQLHR